MTSSFHAVDVGFCEGVRANISSRGSLSFSLGFGRCSLSLMLTTGILDQPTTSTTGDCRTPQRVHCLSRRRRPLGFAGGGRDWRQREVCPGQREEARHGKGRAQGNH